MEVLGFKIVRENRNEIKKISNGLYVFNNTTPNYSVGDHIRNFEIFVFDLDKKMLIYIIFNS